MSDTDSTTEAPNLRDQGKTLLARLTETYPAAFPPSGQRQIRPLMIGIHKQLIQVAQQWGFDRTVLRIALGMHTRQLRYQQGIIASEQRVDLAGVDAGEVTDDNRKVALERIAEIQARRQAARQPRERPRRDKLTPRAARQTTAAAADPGPVTDASVPGPSGTAVEPASRARQAPERHKRTARRKAPGPVTTEALEALAAKFNRR